MSVLIDSAYDLCLRKGKDITLKRITTGAYNPATSSATQSSVNHSFKGMILNYTNREIDGSLILRGDRKIVLAAKGATVVPVISDQISVDSEVLKVVDVRQIEETGVDVVYICQCRR